MTALTVRANGDGKFVLVAGERRLIAAKRADIKEVPVVIREGKDALAAAIAENLIREDLDPIEEARGLQRLSEAEKLGTHKQLAARVGKSSAYVSERLRLLALPEKVQARIAEGSVPVAAERDLRKAAKVCPAVAECACQLVASGEIEGRDLLERFDEVLYAVAESDLRERPTMIDVGRGIWLSQLVDDPEQHALIAERWRLATPYGNADDPMIRFEEPEIDAARAAGSLLEYEVDRGGWTATSPSSATSSWPPTSPTATLERAEKEAVKRAKAASRESRRNSRRTRSELPPRRSCGGPGVSCARRRSSTPKKRATFNLDLGRN